MLGIVAYDIADDKRRTRLRKLLEGYGVAAQESVFVLDLNDARWQEVERKVLRVTNALEDDVRVWPLCRACVGRSRVWRGAGIRRFEAVTVV